MYAGSYLHSSNNFCCYLLLINMIKDTILTRQSRNQTGAKKEKNQTGLDYFFLSRLSCDPV